MCHPGSAVLSGQKRVFFPTDTGTAGGSSIHNWLPAVTNTCVLLLSILLKAYISCAPLGSHVSNRTLFAASLRSRRLADVYGTVRRACLEDEVICQSRFGHER